MANKKKDDLQAGHGSIVIGGDVTGSNIVQGNHNVIAHQTIRLNPFFQTIYKVVEEHSTLTPSEKEDVKAELEEVKSALEEKQPDVSFLARRFRNLKRMSPDIVDVAMETLKNPMSGVAEIIKKVANKIKEDAG